MKRPLARERQQAALWIAVAVACLLPGTGRAEKPPGQADLDRIAAKLEAQAWGMASADCEALAIAIAWHDDSWEISPEFLAELTTRCAIAAAGMGQGELASFDWHVAVLFDRATAERVAERLGGAVELPPIRGEVPIERAADGSRALVGLLHPDGSPIGGGAQEPRLREHWKRSRLPGTLQRAIRSAGKPNGARLVIEYVLGANGRASEPRLVSSTAWSPQATFWVLSWLRELTFQPARSEGKPVAVLYDWVFPEGL